MCATGEGFQVGAENQHFVRLAPIIHRVYISPIFSSPLFLPSRRNERNFFFLFFLFFAFLPHFRISSVSRATRVAAQIAENRKRKKKKRNERQRRTKNEHEFVARDKLADKGIEILIDDEETCPVILSSLSLAHPSFLSR